MLKKLKLKWHSFFYKKNGYSDKLFCHAPYSSLYFDYNGYIYSCFVNKTVCIGNIDNFEHLTEIWNSLQLSQLRNDIIKLNLSNGCYVCQYHLLNGSYSNVYAYRYKNLPISNFPTSIEVQLKNSCNLECVMCVVSKEKSRITSIEKHKKIIEEALPYLTNMSFSGGEPFLIDEYYDLWELCYLVNPNCTISLNTNGTILNDKVLDVLNKLKFNITISVDGFTKNTFEAVRKGADRDIVYKNIEFFHNYAKQQQTSFGVKICALNQNIYEFPLVFDYFSKKNISITINEVVYPLNVALWNNSSEKISDIINYLIRNKPSLYNNNFNINSWNGLIITLNNYYKKRLMFECSDLKNLKRSEILAWKNICNYFSSESDAKIFFDSIINLLSSERERKIFFDFINSAPVERIIPEMNTRSKSQLKELVKTIITDFVTV